jgi:hypothetical protein
LQSQRAKAANADTEGEIAMALVFVLTTLFEKYSCHNFPPYLYETEQI